MHFFATTLASAHPKRSLRIAPAYVALGRRFTERKDTNSNQARSAPFSVQIDATFHPLLTHSHDRATGPTNGSRQHGSMANKLKRETSSSKQAKATTGKKGGENGGAVSERGRVRFSSTGGARHHSRLTLSPGKDLLGAFN